jgi:hypothetical protein
MNPEFENTIAVLAKTAYGSFFNSDTRSFINKTSTPLTFNATSPKLVSFSEESFF